MSSNGLSLPARRMNSALTSSSVRSREPLGLSWTFSWTVPWTFIRNSTDNELRSGDVFRRSLVLEDRNLRRNAGEAKLVPARRHLLVGLLVELGARRERLDVLVIHAGVDQRLRA